MGWAVTWLCVALGLASGSVEAASNAPMPLILLPFLSSAFVPTDSMPAGLAWFAEHQPFTPIIETLRACLDGHDPGSDAWSAIGWCVLITVLCFWWAGRLFGRGSGRLSTMLTISQLAAYAGVTVRAVRHYHQIGLLPEPARDGSGYRTYDAADVVRLIRIRTLAEAGVPLARVQDLLDATPDGVRDGGRRRSTPSCARRIRELQEHRRRIARLAAGDSLAVAARGGRRTSTSCAPAARPTRWSRASATPGS